MDVDAVVSSLPPGWVIWVGSDGQIMGQITDGRHRETLEGKTFTALLQKMSEFKLLPYIKRCPDVFLASEYEPMRVDGGWMPRHHKTGVPIECRYKTRKACTDAMVQWEANRRQAIDEWHKAFAAMFPNGGTEGVDFRYTTAAPCRTEESR